VEHELLLRYAMRQVLGSGVPPEEKLALEDVRYIERYAQSCAARRGRAPAALLSFRKTSLTMYIKFVILRHNAHDTPRDRKRWRIVINRSRSGLRWRWRGSCAALRACECGRRVLAD
jgi:hypothetical protein